MRTELEKLDGVKSKFSGIFIEFGCRKIRCSKKVETTILLRDIKDKKQNVVADHVWFTVNLEFKPKKGNILEFHARVGKYKTKNKTDYKFIYPENFRIL